MTLTTIALGADSGSSETSATTPPLMRSTLWWVVPEEHPDWQRADAEFWVNVETGECNVKNWDEYLVYEKQRNVPTAIYEEPWRFTPMDWLAQKLELAARHGQSIVNWGYFPYMDPMPNPDKALPGQAEAYAAYKAYYEKTRAAGGAQRPLP